MIKKYKIFKESLLDKLKGPTDEEIRKSLSELDVIKWVKKVKNNNLDDSFLPSKKDVEKKFLNNEIDSEDYYDVCKLLKYEFISSEIIYKEKITKLYNKFNGDKEKLFKYLTNGIKLVIINNYLNYGNYNVIYFKFEPNNKILYMNQSILKNFLLLFTDDEINEYLDYLFGELLNSKKLRGNVYLSKLKMGGSWTY